MWRIYLPSGKLSDMLKIGRRARDAAMEIVLVGLNALLKVTPAGGKDPGGAVFDMETRSIIRSPRRRKVKPAASCALILTASCALGRTGLLPANYEANLSARASAATTWTPRRTHGGMLRVALGLRISC